MRPDQISYFKHLPSSPPAIPVSPACEPRKSPPHTVRGAWIWHVQRLLDQHGALSVLLKQVRSLHLNRLYLAVSGNLSADAPMLREIESRGITVYATLGDPSDIDHWHRVDHAVGAVLAFNRLHGHGFSGLQFDIEPYVLKGFAEHRRELYARYVRLLRKLRIRIGSSLPWSVVVPFWFDQIRWGPGNLLAVVLRQADGITIMAYRSHYRKILALARNGLCAGQLMGKSVELGVEMAPMPNQLHYFLTRRQFRRDIRNHHGHLYFAGEKPPSGRIALHYEVHGSALSFYPDMGSVARLIDRRPGYGSFGGWIIDGLKEGAHAIKNH